MESYDSFDGIPTAVKRRSHDWGHARDYVTGMWANLQQDTHTVREFSEAAFAAAGYRMVWKSEGTEERGVDAKTGRTLVEVDGDVSGRRAGLLRLSGHSFRVISSWSTKMHATFGGHF